LSMLPGVLKLARELLKRKSSSMKPALNTCEMNSC